MPRPKQLVCQHLEGASRSLLEKYREVIRGYLQGRHGVYALYRGERLYYVGLASDLRRRLKHHLRDRHGQSWDRFSIYLTIGSGHLRELESLVLRILQPRGNRNRTRFARSENLLQRLRREVRERHRSEEEELLGSRRRARKPVVRRKSSRARKPEGPRAELAPYVSEPMRIRARHKRKTFRARLRRDGMIRYEGTLYRTPTAAGRAVLGRGCNGWDFWEYERAPGDWVKLEELRR